MSPLSLYLKLTNGCPLSCGHCYLPEPARKDSSVMERDAMEDALRRLLAQSGSRPIHVSLHGGEPLLPGHALLKERIMAIESLLGARLDGWSIQSSLVGLDGPIIELLAGHGFQVGTSYDNFRLNRHPGLLRHWEKQVALLRDAGLSVGVSWAPGRGDDPKDVARALGRIGFQSARVDRCLGAGCPTNAEHTDLLKAMYRAQQETGFVFATVEAAKAVLQGRTADRWGTRCRQDFIVLGPHGERHFCPDRSFHWRDNLLGDRRNAALRVTQCLGCEWHGICAGGCPITPLDDGSGECAGYRVFLDFLRAAETEWRIAA